MPSARENADVEQKARNASVLSGMNGLASMVAISTKGTGAPKKSRAYRCRGAVSGGGR